MSGVYYPVICVTYFLDRFFDSVLSPPLPLKNSVTLNTTPWTTPFLICFSSDSVLSIATRRVRFFINSFMKCSIFPSIFQYLIFFYFQGWLRLGSMFLSSRMYTGLLFTILSRTFHRQLVRDIGL
jgi:hypothetical protein